MTIREPTAAELQSGILALTTALVRAGLVDDQEWPTISRSGRKTTVSTAAGPNRDVIKASTYSDLYEGQARSRSFNFVMLDKALVHMTYEFDGRRLKRHRLSFLPSPQVVEFQNDPELYLREHLFIDVVGGQSVAVPVRFDFDDRSEASDSVDHPVSHLTLGQYLHCRIPVSSAVTPWVFVDFLVRHFYEGPGMTPIDIDLTLDRRFEGGERANLSELLHIASPPSAIASPGQNAGRQH